MKRKNESGVVVVEALIVVTIVVMFITVMLYLGMILYQQSLVNIMANQTASSIAQIYGNTLRDPFTGYVDADGVDETVTYANLRNEAYYNVIKQKADAFALYRLKSSRILNTGTTEVEIDIIPKKNELIKEQIVVTVKDSYAVSMVSFFGINDNKLTFTGTGRADCVDLLEYYAGIPALGTDDANAVIFTAEERECTVNFYRHRGDTRPIKTVTVLQGYSVNGSTDKSHSTMPAKPTQDKMRFVKWLTEDGHTFTGGSIVNRDMNVYGLWECTVTFDPDGGTLSPQSVVATVGGNIRLPQPTRDNCTFAGWYTEKNGKGEEFTGIAVQGDITVYAKWVCTVSFEPDQGSVGVPSLDVVYGQSLRQAGHSLPTATRNGCTFAGWYMRNFGEGGSFTADQTVQGHTTVVAKWTCVIRFFDDNGTKLLSDLTAVAGLTANIQTPNRAHDGVQGWQFLGWKDSSGASYDSTTIIRNNVDLRASWSCNHVVDYSKAVSWHTAAKCTETSYAIHKCKYCDHTERKDGARGECTRNGHCGGRCHSYGGGTWGETDQHPIVCKNVTWAACWQCPDCFVVDGVVCGVCITRNGGYGVNTHKHG